MLGDRLIQCVVLGLAMVATSGYEQRPPGGQDPTRVVSTHRLAGRFLGVCTGDYRHVGLQPKTGKARWFFVLDRAPGIDYFLAAHQGEWVNGSYEVIDTFIPEAGGRQIMEVLVDAKVGTASYRDWRAVVRPPFPPGEKLRKYEALVTKATVDCSKQTGGRVPNN